MSSTTQSKTSTTQNQYTFPYTKIDELFWHVTVSDLIDLCQVVFQKPQSQPLEHDNAKGIPDYKSMSRQELEQLLRSDPTFMQEAEDANNHCYGHGTELSNFSNAYLKYISRYRTQWHRASGITPWSLNYDSYGYRKNIKLGDYVRGKYGERYIVTGIYRNGMSIDLTSYPSNPPEKCKQNSNTNEDSQIHTSTWTYRGKNDNTYQRWAEKGVKTKAFLVWDIDFGNHSIHECQQI